MTADRPAASAGRSAHVPDGYRNEDEHAGADGEEPYGLLPVRGRAELPYGLGLGEAPGSDAGAVGEQRQEGPAGHGQKARDLLHVVVWDEAVVGSLPVCVAARDGLVAVGPGGGSGVAGRAVGDVSHSVTVAAAGP